jgi:hypothetical protein
MTLSIDQLPAEQLRAVLSFALDDLDDDSAAAVGDFLQRIGGRENALLAVEMLEQIEREEF